MFTQIATAPSGLTGVFLYDIVYKVTSEVVTYFGIYIDIDTAASRIYSSPDGVVWTLIANDPFASAGAYVYAPSLYIAGGVLYATFSTPEFEYRARWKSLDNGVSWAQDSANIGYRIYLTPSKDIEFNGDVYSITSDDEISPGSYVLHIRKNDVIVYTPAAGTLPWSITTDGTTIWAVAKTGSSIVRVFTSTDGTSWTAVTVVTSIQPMSNMIVCMGALYVVDYNTGNRLVYSVDDGATWGELGEGASNLPDVSSGTSRFILYPISTLISPSEAPTQYGYTWTATVRKITTTTYEVETITENKGYSQLHMLITRWDLIEPGAYGNYTIVRSVPAELMNPLIWDNHFPTDAGEGVNNNYLWGVGGVRGQSPSDFRNQRIGRKPVWGVDAWGYDTTIDGSPGTPDIPGYNIVVPGRTGIPLVHLDPTTGDYLDQSGNILTPFTVGSNALVTIGGRRTLIVTTITSGELRFGINVDAIDVPAITGYVPASSFSQTITFPGASFFMQDGSIEAPYPTFHGALLFDFFHKKWGKFKGTYQLLTEFVPINSSSKGSLSYRDMGADAGILDPLGDIYVFDSRPSDSIIRYGKIGFSRQGFSFLSEIRVQFRSPYTGTIAVYGSLDGKTIEPAMTSSSNFSEAIEAICYPDKSARWFAISISGNYDLTGVQLQGNIAGRR